MKQFFLALALTLIATTGIQAQTKVAHINSQALLDTMPSRKKAIADLNVIQQRGVLELQEMEAALQGQYQKHMNEKAGKSPTIVAYEEEQIMKGQQRLEQRQNELDAEFKALNQQIFDPIDARMRKAVDIVATRNKIGYVIEESNAWYTKGGSDITNEVMTELLKLEAEGK